MTRYRVEPYDKSTNRHHVVTDTGAVLLAVEDSGAIAVALNNAYEAGAESLRAENARLRAACEAALDRMEAVSKGIPIENRAKGISQRAHVAHMAGHLAQHAKIFRAALAGKDGGK